MSAYYSPLRYPGGKNCVFPFVSRLFYENSLIGMRYAEPYAGGAGLALRLLFEGFVDHVYINDLDRSIYAFWKTLTERPVDFCDWVHEVEVSVRGWHRYKEIQNNSANASLWDLACSTFFLNRTNVSGVIKGGIIGGLEQHGRYKIDARFNKNDLIRRMRRISSVSNRISVSNDDGLAFARKIDRQKRDCLIYLDPPYYCKGADLYMNFFSDKDHQALSRCVHSLRNRWLVSYDNHNFIRTLYPDKRKIIHKLSQSASNRVGDEIFIFSDALSFSESQDALRSPLPLH